MLLLVCFAVPAWYLATGPMYGNLRFERGLSWTWELPEPLPWVVALLYPGALLLLLPDVMALWQRQKLLVVLLVGAGAPLLFVAGLISGAIVAQGTWMLDYRIVHLDDPGPYERAVIEAVGRMEFDAGLWVRRGSDGFERIADPYDYPPCEWPFEVRKSPDLPRYLVVDSRLRASALLDLDVEPAHWRIVEQMPPLEELRREFGEDITEIATWEN